MIRISDPTLIGPILGDYRTMLGLTRIDIARPIAAKLAKAAAIDNRVQSDTAILAWHEIIGSLDVRDALAAVTRHRIEAPDVYLQPGHVLRLAEKVRAERQEIEDREQRHRELEAYRAQAGPLTDRSTEIRDFVHQVRDALPEGSTEALYPRREHWRREYQAHQRQLTTEPNPEFNSALEPTATWQASKHPPVGAWWEDDAEREADATRLLAQAGRLRRRTEQTELDRTKDGHDQAD